jgi:Uma2 family endonuclease
MSTVLSELTYSPEDLLSLPDDGKRYELVGGRLVEINVGGFSDWVSGRVLRLLGEFGEDRGLGCVISETGYQCFTDDPKKVRKPDVSFIRRGRFPGERIPDGHIGITPDLAVEVVSPNDTAYEVDAKVEEYLAAGVPLVWVVNPQVRTVHVYRNDSVERLREGDVLTVPELIPELRCRVADLFTLPAPR